MLIIKIVLTLYQQIKTARYMTHQEFTEEMDKLKAETRRVLGELQELNRKEAELEALIAKQDIKIKTIKKISSFMATANTIPLKFKDLGLKVGQRATAGHDLYGNVLVECIKDFSECIGRVQDHALAHVKVITGTLYNAHVWYSNWYAQTPQTLK